MAPRNFLSLPYDIRYLVYQHLFPRDNQLYIQALGSTLQIIYPDGTIPVHLLRVSRQLRGEAGEYLYGSYLFNIIGTKADCLASYDSFLSTLSTYARADPRVDAFGNGNHSSTACISIQAGEAKLAVLRSRRRGQPRQIQELRNECEETVSSPSPTFRFVSYVHLVGALFAALIAWLFWRRP